MKDDLQPAKPPRRRRRVRILIASVVVLFLLPVGVMHGMGLFAAMHDHSMDVFWSRIVTDAYGHTIHYYEVKQPDAQWTIIYIHGTPGSASAFREQFVHPFPNANIIALDRPGFGGSKPSRRRPSLDDQANAIEILLTNEPPGRVILVGHSYGAPIALLAALKFTNQVAGVVLIGGSVDPAQEHIMVIQRIGDWPVLEWLVPHWLRQCNRELLTLRGDLLRLKPEIATLTVPVVMLHGVKDPLVPIANVDYLRAQLTAAGKSNLFDTLVYPDYNHFIPWEHPEAVEAAIKKITDRPTQR